MKKKMSSLLFKFAVIFLLFTVVTLVMSGINTYINQSNIYKAQCEEDIQHIASYLETLMKAEGKEFVVYQDYILGHAEEVMIPIDFSGDYLPDQRKYEKMFAEAYPGKVYGADISFEELSDEVKLAYVTYKQEYWMSVFESAKRDFGIAYTYYLVPTGEDFHMYYIIDGVRMERKVGDKTYIQLCDDVPQRLEAHRCMWTAWETGKRAQGYDTYDNEYGKTYAYYSPLIINGKKMGVIGTEVEIANVSKAILYNTLRQMVGMGIILILAVGVLLTVIYQGYIVKLSHLKDSIGAYANGKDPQIADEIEKEANSGDEISALCMQIAAMIVELDNYMKNLVQTTKELTDTKKKADEMNELAQRDPLTGIRNKTAYDNEVKKIEWSMHDGFQDFGIAMIDLNFLKRINDTYGHDQGNLAIKKLCHMVCVIFRHSPVFRIGGDEFVVIVENEDYENVDMLVEEFNSKLDQLDKDESLEPWERISAAIGVAMFDPIIDNNVTNVFKRADKAMYMRKKDMKAVREQ